MKSLGVVTICAILIIVVAITIADAQKKAADKKSKSNVNSAGNKKGSGKALKKTSTSKPTTRRRKSSTMLFKTTKKTTGTTASTFKLASSFEDDAPDNEAGSDCFDACYPNTSLLTAEGKVRSPENYGKILETNGKKFLVGSMQLGSWRDNWKTCCSIGMQPLLLTEKTKINDFITAVGLAKIEKETRFWTGGFKHEISNMWSWCTKDTPLPIGNDLLKNVSNSAEIERNCVSINIDMGNPKSTIIANIFCNTDETTDPTPPNLACELIAKKPNDKMIVNSTCRGTSCGINHQCKKNDAVKKLADKGVDLSNIRYGSGLHLSACSRYFLFSYESTTYDDARDKCCALGMKLLSVKSAAKRYCLATLTKSYMEKTGDNDISDVFWTSGTDLDCKGNYRWCSVDRAFVKSEVRWATIKPTAKSERCVTVQMSDMETNTALQTADCSAIKRFVCEVRQSGTTVRSIQDECIELIGLSKDEVDGLDNTKNYTYSMKCFLKCVADNLGMIIFGNMKGGNTLRLMEKYDKENYDFIKNTQTINLCNTKLVPNSDVCQSTYEMFLCGISRQRQFFNKIMSPNNKSNNNDNEPTLMPEIPRACYNRMNVRCGRNKFTYELVTGIDGRDWHKSALGNYTYVGAFTYCCDRGMQLPAATSLDEFMKIRDWMDGANYDNFFGETYTDPQTNEERWCFTDAVLSPELSDDNFKLEKEQSFLFSPKGSTAPKMQSVPYSNMSSVIVPFIYCQPL